MALRQPSPVPAEAGLAHDERVEQDEEADDDEDVRGAVGAIATDVQSEAVLGLGVKPESTGSFWTVFALAARGGSW